MHLGNISCGVQQQDGRIRSLASRIEQLSGQSTPTVAFSNTLCKTLSDKTQTLVPPALLARRRRVVEVAFGTPVCSYGVLRCLANSVDGSRIEFLVSCAARRERHNSHEDRYDRRRERHRTRPAQTSRSMTGIRSSSIESS